MSSQAKRFIEENIETIEGIEKGNTKQIIAQALKEGGVKLLYEIQKIFEKCDINHLADFLPLKEHKTFINYFKFHPVGQGLFYTGSIANDSFNFVYDCGSSSGNTYIEDSIEKYVSSLRTFGPNKPIINFAVISHLHVDHFNGIMSLWDKATIQQIILPYIGNDTDFIALILAHAIFLNIEANRTEQSIELFDFMLRLYEVNKHGEHRVNFDYEKTSKKGAYVFVEQRKTIPVGNSYWHFVFINRRIPKNKLDLLIAEMKKAMVTLGVSSIRDLVHNHKIDVVKKIYDKVFKANHNISSTIMLHYPIEPSAFNEKAPTISSSSIKFFSFSNRSVSFIPSKLASSTTLLTGDAMINKNSSEEIKRCYPNNIDTVGVLQLPHHGSYRNFKTMNKQGIQANVYVATYGLGNQYKHPSKETVDDLYNNKKALYSANQYAFFDYIIE
jgi:beta-lactamase superfamily II metal-dependent hydrolase